MQALMEPVFSAAYLVLVILMGFSIIKQNKDSKQYKLFGIMTLILGFGDAFHLVPRLTALLTTGIEDYTVSLGFGKLVTSITMTIFYVLLYQVWKIRYGKEKKVLDIFVYALAIVRIALCFFPQNRWMYADSPVEWGIYRNIPFVILGLLVIIIYYQAAKKSGDSVFRLLWLAVSLSFVFYIPVVLWAGKNTLIGMLMLPKTCAYLWIVWMGYRGKGR